MKIRKQVESILELHITDWDDTWQAAEVQGKMTGAKTNKILKIVCQAIEQIQDNQDETPLESPTK